MHNTYIKESLKNMFIQMKLAPRNWNNPVQVTQDGLGLGKLSTSRKSESITTFKTLDKEFLKITNIILDSLLAYSDEDSRPKDDMP